MGIAALLDVLILRWRKKAWEFPSGAILTGLIVAMVLSAHEPWYVPVSTSALAIVSHSDMAALAPARLARAMAPQYGLKLFDPPYASPPIALRSSSMITTIRPVSVSCWTRYR